MKLYPLQFQPLFKYRLWGGEQLKTELGKEYSETNIGESWEISDVDTNETKVLNGDLKDFTLKQLIKKYKGDFLGQSVYDTFGENFPLLIKFIDAKTPLSVQVHPSNEIAKIRHNSFGKNEMWFVMQAEKNAELIVGFEEKITPSQFETHLKHDTILNVLHKETVQKGDTFYIPTGRVHAIGGGVMLAEIQQTSNITYRIYDYNRVDKTTGQQRELHTEQAKDVLDFTVHKNYKTDYKKKVNTSNKLIHSSYFKSNFLKIEGTLVKDYTKLDSFVIYMCVDGHVKINWKDKIYLLKKGETILLPASIKNISLSSTSCELLEVYL
ncbi:type I phosphomannose isomerase catalytic subunit [Olleya sp. YS]|uniref:type I phosphomannose isomerase catalytic subunit n=1 Tax=Olleya sp. YS TaxID=3028318 RepID=UPI00243456A2|nr:type I phosphomannose isomerase catalytic subunit [Olleya sp. YS]WGD36108.1 mannose-6-phosphate isomerase [Olleya sp. YS]